MGYLDIIILLPLLIAGYKGYKKGLVLTVFALLALLVGLYGAVHFSTYTADFLRDNMGLKSEWMSVISFTITFILLVVAVHLLGKLIEKLVHIVALKTMNKLLGLLFNVLKVLIILSVLLVILESVENRVDFLPQELRSNSLLYYPIHDLTEDFLPEFDSSKLLDLDGFHFGSD